MYYSWSWWWFMSWVIPMLLLVWVIFGWNVRRDGYRSYYTRRSNFDDDDRPSREALSARNRGRGPLNYVRSDERIADDIVERMTVDDELDASAIELHVDHAVVTLNGRVQSRKDKRRAEAIVDGVLGVKDVDNHLEIGPLSQAAAKPEHAGSVPAHQP